MKRWQKAGTWKTRAQLLVSSVVSTTRLPYRWALEWYLIRHQLCPLAIQSRPTGSSTWNIFAVRGMSTEPKDSVPHSRPKAVAPPPAVTPTRYVWKCFQKIDKVGQGTYGYVNAFQLFLKLSCEVLKAMDRTTHETVALKRIKMEKEQEGVCTDHQPRIHTVLVSHHSNQRNQNSERVEAQEHYQPSWSGDLWRHFRLSSTILTWHRYLWHVSVFGFWIHGPWSGRTDELICQGRNHLGNSKVLDEATSRSSSLHAYEQSHSSRFER